MSKDLKSLFTSANDVLRSIVRTALLLPVLPFVLFFDWLCDDDWRETLQFVWKGTLR